MFRQETGNTGKSFRESFKDITIRLQKHFLVYSQ